jgi:proline iminopeptidase
LVLRGVFLGRASDLAWFFEGAAQLLPDAWQQLADAVANQPGLGVLHRLHAGLQATDGGSALACASAWEAWEQSLTQQRLVAPRWLEPLATEAQQLLGKYRLQSHYLINQCFREGAGLLQDASALAKLPIAILHGRRDWICRPQTAWELHHALPGSRLHWVAGCGHSPFEPANAAALVDAIQHFATHGDFAAWGAALPHTSTP